MPTPLAQNENPDRIRLLWFRLRDLPCSTVLRERNLISWVCLVWADPPLSVADLHAKLHSNSIAEVLRALKHFQSGEAWRLSSALAASRRILDFLPAVVLR